MKRIILTIIFMSMAIPSFCQLPVKTITLHHVDNPIVKYFYHELDSITYDYNNGFVTEVLWHCGEQKAVNKISDNDYIMLSEEQPSYKIFDKDEYGFDGVYTNDGQFAALVSEEEFPDGKILGVFGKYSSPDEWDYAIFSENGLIEGLKIADRTFAFFYGNEGLLVFEGYTYIGCIPYDSSPMLESRITSRASSLTRNPIYNFLNLLSTLGDIIKEPVFESVKEVILKMTHGNQDNLLISLLNLIKDKDLLSLIEFLDKVLDEYYLGSSSIETLEAVRNSMCDYDLGCKVQISDKTTGFWRENKFRGISANYTIFMTLYDNKIGGNKTTKEQPASNKEIYTFNFADLDLETSYSYEPQLKVEYQISDKAYWFGLGYTSETIPDPRKETHSIYGEKKNFYIGNPTSQIDKIFDQNFTSGKISCTFGSIPSSATCFVKVIGGSNEKTFTTDRQEGTKIIEAIGLMPNTDYTCIPGVKYKGHEYMSVWGGVLSTLTPSVALKDVPNEDVTEKTATIHYNVDAESSMNVFLEYSDESGTTHKETLSTFSSEIVLSNLESATSYTAIARIEFQGGKWESNTILFTTKVPSICGTWNVVETYSTRPFPGADWQTKTREYSLTLNEDGSIQISGIGYEYIAGSWGYGGGRFSATGHIFATQTQISWDRFDGKVDDVKNPQKIIGTRYSGNMNQVTNVENAVGSIVMTR